MKALKVYALAALLLLALMPPLAYGHLEGGSFQTRIFPDYRLQFDIYPPFPVASRDSLLSFSIQDAHGMNRMNVTASVTISKGGVEVRRYPKNLYPSGDFTLQHAFQEEGVHVVTLEVHGSESPLRAEFELTVHGEPLLWLVNYGLIALAAGVLAVVGYFNLRKWRRFSHLTAEEAYRYRLRGLLFLSSGLVLMLIVVSPWSAQLEDENLLFHMVVEHTGLTLGPMLLLKGTENHILSILSSGSKTLAAKLITSFYTKAIKVNRRLNRHGAIGALVGAFLLAYWHIPENFNAAVLEPSVHANMHASFVTVGMMIFLNAKVLSRAEMVAQSLVLMQAMMILGVIMIIAPAPLYLPYSLSQQAETGLVMAAPHPFVIAVLAVYVFNRYLWSQ